MYTRNDVLKAADAVGAATKLEVFATGSALFYDDGADMDVVARGDEGDATAVLDSGYTLCAGLTYGEPSKFTALRKGPVNVIIVHSDALWERWAAATLAVLKLKDAGVLLDKAQRAALFEGVKDLAAIDTLDDRPEYECV